jgi:hypothetical protein
MLLTKFQEDKKGHSRNWKEMNVSLSVNRKIPWKQADIIIKNHIISILTPFSQACICESSKAEMFLKKDITPMEKALLLRIISSTNNFLDTLNKDDANFICSFLWNSETSASLKSKVELFRKYLNKEIISLVDSSCSYNFDVSTDIFNITEMIFYNHRAISSWAKEHKLTSKEADYIVRTFGNGGYKNQEHYRNSIEVLGTLFSNTNKDNQNQINDMFIKSAEIEEIHTWSQLSNQSILDIALRCFCQKDTKFSSFAKGVILQAGISNVLNEIEDKQQLKGICSLFDLCPSEILFGEYEINDHTKTLTTEVICDGME